MLSSLHPAHPIPLATAGGTRLGSSAFCQLGRWSEPASESHQLLLMPETLEAVLGPAKCLLWGRTQTCSPEPVLGNRLKY